jgi:hypothetical protein
MAEPARPDPLAAAHRVKDLARDLAGDLAEGYRRSSRYARLRGGILGGWALLSAFAIWVTCLPSGGANALGAEVQLLADSIMGTQLLVKNDSDRNWTEVAFTLDGGWQHGRRTVRAGDKVVVPLASFARDGEHPPEALQPRELEIRCAEGRVTAPLGGR